MKNFGNHETPPFTFRTIDLHFNIQSPDSGIADVEKAIHLAETSMCPVWATIKGNVEVTPGFTLNGEGRFSSSENNSE